jgi:hypothetical protein
MKSSWAIVGKLLIKSRQDNLIIIGSIQSDLILPLQYIQYSSRLVSSVENLDQPLMSNGRTVNFLIISVKVVFTCRLSEGTLINVLI